MAGPLSQPPLPAKLGTVLDYVPCEACLAVPAASREEQDLLCSVCHRLDRTVGVKFVVRTSVLMDRPEPAMPEAPVVIPPAQEAPEAEPQPEGPLPIEVVLKRRALFSERRTGAAIEVVVEPYEDPALVPLPVPVPAPEPEPEWEDVVSWSAEAQEEPAFDAFGYTRPEPEPEPEPAVEADDFVFEPPAEETPVEAEDEPEDAWEAPPEEIPLEPPQEEESPWARPAEEPEPEPEEEVLEMEVVEDEEEPVEMEVLEDEPEPPAPAPEPEEPADDSDLWRLDGFDAAAREALTLCGVDAIAHLSGHDAEEFSVRTGLKADLLQAWIHVADLVQEAGVPIDGARTLVAAGVEGPRGLATLEAEEVARRVQSTGGDVSEREIKRWKRRV